METLCCYLVYGTLLVLSFFVSCTLPSVNDIISFSLFIIIYECSVFLLHLILMLLLGKQKYQKYIYPVLGDNHFPCVSLYPVITLVEYMSNHFKTCSGKDFSHEEISASIYTFCEFFRCINADDIQNYFHQCYYTFSFENNQEPRCKLYKSIFWKHHSYIKDYPLLVVKMVILDYILHEYEYADEHIEIDPQHIKIFVDILNGLAWLTSPGDKIYNQIRNMNLPDNRKLLQNLIVDIFNRRSQ